MFKAKFILKIFNIVNRATRFRHMGPTSVCFIDLLKILLNSKFV